MPKTTKKRSSNNKQGASTSPSKRQHSNQPAVDDGATTTSSVARLQPASLLPSTPTRQQPPTQQPTQPTTTTSIASPIRPMPTLTSGSQQSVSSSNRVPVSTVQVNHTTPTVNAGVATNEDLTTERSSSVVYRELVQSSKDQHALRQTVRSFVTESFFPHVKFITRVSKLAYYDAKTHPNTFCAHITKGCNLPPHINPATWWESIARKEVRSKVSQLRCDKLTALKWDYYGKYML